MFRRGLTIAFLFLLLAGVVGGAVVHDTILYKTPVRRISGHIEGFGNINPGVRVRIFDRPEV
jgi:hypothetical protein